MTRLRRRQDDHNAGRPPHRWDHKILFVLKTSAGRTVRCAWLLILKRNLTALEFPRFQGLSRSTGQSSSNPLSVPRHRRVRQTTVSISRTLIGGAPHRPAPTGLLLPDTPVHAF